MAGSIPQSEPLEAGQEKNSAGGFTWRVDDMNRLRRFLCLGSEGGTYYIKEKQLGRENALTIVSLIKKGKGAEVVEEIKKFSLEGRAAKQNPIIFALALCARQDDCQATKKNAYAAVADVCRIPTHLFTFVEYCEALSRGTGWGRAHRRAISNWYTRFHDNPRQLANHVTKYRSRGGWSHTDVLRLAHTKPGSDGVAAVLRYVIKGMEAAQNAALTDDGKVRKTLQFLQAVEDAKAAGHEDQLVELIRAQHLVREHVPTHFLGSVPVWQALLVNMPMTAMIRNLGKMSAVGLFGEPYFRDLVVEKLGDEEQLRKARVHPFNVLVALKTYEKGKGEKGKLSWLAEPGICAALDKAYYLSFKNVEPTKQRYCLAVDVSGSMDCGSVCGSEGISPRTGAAALAMVTLRSEAHCHSVAFSHNICDLAINSDMPLQDVINTMARVPMGATDCAQPMLWAKKHGRKFDVFVIYTDCETWCGGTHPAEAVRQYRRATGLTHAKVIVVAMTSNGFTIADPEDPGMLDMAGFDSAGPEVMRQFVLEQL